MYKTLLILLVLALALLVSDQAWAKSTNATISIYAQVDGFAEWATPGPIILQSDWTGHISNMTQEQTVTKLVVLYANTDTLLTPSPGLNRGVLTYNGNTLQTSYRISGAVAQPDGAFKPAAQFFSASNKYTVIHVPSTGAYTINLSVKAASPADAAPDPGVYTCSVVLTASW
ncbi:MAG: hypothetical protein WCI73_05990 [Phycisphaerae bacterium]